MNWMGIYTQISGNLIHYLQHLNYYFHGKTSPTTQEISIWMNFGIWLFARGDFLHEWRYQYWSRHCWEPLRGCLWSPIHPLCSGAHPSATTLFSSSLFILIKEDRSRRQKSRCLTWLCPNQLHDLRKVFLLRLPWLQIIGVSWTHGRLPTSYIFQSTLCHPCTGSDIWLIT